jgi:hypothetical protein
MKREEPAETGSPTLRERLSTVEDGLEGDALAAISNDWRKRRFDHWRSDVLPPEEDQTREG